MGAYGGQLPGGIPHQQQQWFNMPPMYGQAAAGWGGDWYNNANMANYYGQQGGQGAAQANAGPGGAPTHGHGGYSGNAGQYPQGGFKQNRGGRVFNGGYEGQLNNQH
uniref:CX domain-containing protein n=1 Tax=Panagrellus redivivus TaxID=6233 RepID=A0A7E4UQZ0_PANRE